MPSVRDCFAIRPGSGQMVMAYLGVNVTQCAEANDRFSRSDCCNSPTPSACVVGGWPEFEKHGITHALTNNAALSWADVQPDRGAQPAQSLLGAALRLQLALGRRRRSHDGGAR